MKAANTLVPLILTEAITSGSRDAHWPTHSFSGERSERENADDTLGTTAHSLSKRATVAELHLCCVQGRANSSDCCLPAGNNTSLECDELQ